VVLHRSDSADSGPSNQHLEQSASDESGAILFVRITLYQDFIGTMPLCGHVAKFLEIADGAVTGWG
jgi:hypothetical protein